MGPKSAWQNGEFDNRLCQASSKPDDEMEQLAQLVGLGSTLSPAGAEPAPRVDDAPALEFDLEDELSRAFQSNDAANYPSDMPPPRSALFDTSAIETALAQPSPAPIPAPAPVAPPAAPAQTADPAMDFNDLIADELDRALAAEVAADAVLAGTQAPAIPMHESPPAQSQAVDPNSHEGIEAELSKLMSSAALAPSPQPEPNAASETAPGTVASPAVTDLPPVPDAVLDPWPSSEIVATPDLPEAREPVVEQTPAPQWQPPQMNDFSPPDVDYSDPAADYFDDKIADAVQPAPPEHGKQHIEAVLGGADALVAAATLDVPDDFAKKSGSSPSSTGNTDAFGAELRALLDSHGSDGEQESDNDVFVLADASQKRQTGRRVALSIVLVALLGGSAALGWNYVNSDTGETPTLLASTDPVKVKPEDAGGKVVPNQDQAVYRSVEGANNKALGQDRLKDSTEAPIIVSTAPDAPKLDTRIVQTDTGADAGLLLKPRRVRTVVVRPDGTIVSSTSDQNQLSDNSASLETPILSLQTPVLNTDLTTVAATSGTEAPRAAVTPQPNQQDQIDIARIEPNAVTLQPIGVTPTPVEPVVKPKPVVVAATPKPAAGTDGENLPSVSSPFAVQVSSQRSAAAAKQTYTNLTRRYGSILDGKGVDIKKAVVSGKGTYYRVRIPAQSRSAANSICSQLKARGGDCFVTR